MSYQFKAFLLCSLITICNFANAQGGQTPNSSNETRDHCRTILTAHLATNFGPIFISDNVEDVKDALRKLSNELEFGVRLQERWQFRNPEKLVEAVIPNNKRSRLGYFTSRDQLSNGDPLGDAYEPGTILDNARFTHSLTSQKFKLLLTGATDSSSPDDEEAFLPELIHEKINFRISQVTQAQFAKSKGGFYISLLVKRPKLKSSLPFFGFEIEKIEFMILSDDEGKIRNLRYRSSWPETNNIEYIDSTPASISRLVEDFDADIEILYIYTPEGPR